MAFDAADYRKRVLTPYTRGKLGALQAALRELDQDPSLATPSGVDLADFYDMPAGVGDAEAAAQITAVADALAKAVMMPTFSSAGKNLLSFHERIVARNPKLGTAEFWTKVYEGRAQKTQQSLGDFGRSAAGELAALKVVTAARLRELARSASIPDSVSDAQLAAAVTAGGLTVVPDFPAITASAQALVDIKRELSKTSGSSVLWAIFVEGGAPAEFSILDGFRRNPAGAPLSVATVASALQHADKLPSTDENVALGKVVGIVRGAATSDAELLNLVIAYFVDYGKRIIQEFALQSMALEKFVERTGLDRTDAARILLELGGSSSGAPRGWGEVQALIADGALKDARRLYDSLVAASGGGASTAPEQEKTERALAAAEQKVRDLRAEAEAAVRAGDLETARRALDQALVICTDDENLRAAAQQLPPASPLKFVVATAEDGRTVKLSWEPGFGTTDDVRYQVVRKVGSAPGNYQDGTVVTTGIEGTAVEDAAAPIAADLFYGVAASRGSGYSPVTVAQIVVAPPVSNVRVSSEPTSVTLGWSAHSDARTVEVVQTAPDGRAVTLPVGTQSGAVSTGLTTGATYTYVITAEYTSTSGRPLRSAPVRVTAVPRGAAKAVSSFTLNPRTTEGRTTEVEATWAAVEGFGVEIWHFAQRPDWQFRSRVPMSDIAATGTRLAGRPVARSGTREGVRGATTPGLRYYAAITRDGDDGIVGQVQALGTCPAVANAKAERFGDEVVLSWDWPGPEYEVLVRWRGDGGTGERTVGMSDYRRDGGCRVQVGTAGSTFSIFTVASDGDDEWLSPETSITVTGAAEPVGYDVEFHRKLFGRPSSATVSFQVTGAASFDVVVIGQPGAFMPFDATQGSVLTTHTVTAGTPAVDVRLPDGRGPLWVRAFSQSPGTRLVDPPPTRMKVE